MPDLRDGESVEMKGSGSKPYVLKNVGGVYSCTCPAWRNQSIGIERRTCKHLRRLRGDEAEEARIGSALPAKPMVVEGEAQAPPLLLAQTWDNVTDPTGWWQSEKLDGVRALWDGRQFLSRQGNLFHAPDWFRAGLPDVPLDGELWLGRKKFQRTVSIVRRQDQNDLWREVTFVVFDAPKLEKSFEARMEFVQECLQHQPTYAKAHEHVRCQCVEHLRRELDRLQDLGAEGLMLRQPGSRYESGRSATLLKVKRFQDLEARVLRHEEGAGRHKGRLGALVVELENGTTFSVGTGFSDAEREDPPAIGSFITVRFQELSEAGVPRFPSFVGVRVDAESSIPIPKGAKIVKTAKAPVATVRRFEFSEGNSQKFWEISSQGVDVTVRFGRIGTQGQTQVKSFADEAAASKHAEQLVKQKLAKGYHEAK